MSEPLGPAVLDSFPAATGLHELVGASRAPGNGGGAVPPAPAPAPMPEVPAVEFSPSLFLNALRLVDKLASRALKVEPEEPQTIDELAGAIAPLVQYYAKGTSTVAALWGNLIVALIGVGYMKVEKVQAREPQGGAASESTAAHGGNRDGEP